MCDVWGDILVESMQIIGLMNSRSDKPPSSADRPNIHIHHGVIKHIKFISPQRRKNKVGESKERRAHSYQNNTSGSHLIRGKCQM